MSRVDFDRELAKELVEAAQYYGHAWHFETAFSAGGWRGLWCVVFRGPQGRDLPYTVAVYTTKREAEQAAAELTLEAALG